MASKMSDVIDSLQAPCRCRVQYSQRYLVLRLTVRRIPETISFIKSFSRGSPSVGIAYVTKVTRRLRLKILREFWNVTNYLKDQLLI